MIDLRLGNCLDLLPTLAPQSIDAVIADIPYGTTACKWDTVIPFEPMWEQLKRIAKPKAAIVLFGSQPFTSALVMSNPKWFRHEWVWNKKLSSGALNADVAPLKIHENVLVFSSGAMTYNKQMRSGKPRINKLSYIPNGDIRHDKTSILRGYSNPSGLYNPVSVLEIGNTDRTGEGHSTRKPVALMEYLIKTYTNEGDTVLDFTMGSGTTMVACVNTKRNGIGFEILPEYFEIAKKRIAEAQQQLILL